jgi:hypothetical protein
VDELEKIDFQAPRLLHHHEGRIRQEHIVALTVGEEIL